MSNVRFIDDKNKEFFVCTSAEARIAMKAVTDKRLKIDPVEAEVKEICSDVERLMAMAKVMKPEEVSYSSNGSIMMNELVDMFAELQKEGLFVSYVIMNAKNYSDFVKFERDLLSPKKLQFALKGIMAELWGAKLLIRNIPKDTVYLGSSKRDNDSEDFVKAFHLNKVEAETPEEIPEDRLEKIEASVQSILERLDKTNVKIADSPHKRV